MIWGTALPASLGFLADREGDVMGYNEPDQYGPACCNCDGKQSYYPATSSGWAPLFNPISAAGNWKKTLDVITKSPHPDRGARRIVSPAIAGDPNKQPGVDCTKDPAVAGNSHFCPGWLQMFKATALNLECTDFTGNSTNCWDAISAIQIHAYSRTAAETTDKVRQYYELFHDDFEGTNGRRKKTLWLTETTAGSADAEFVAGYAKDLTDSKTGLGNRAPGARGGFGFVERVSWFSEFFFPAFKVGNYEPKPNEQWVSSLFNPFGGLSPVGEAFFAGCGPVSARGPKVIT